jgi:hypothetical protein
MTAHLASGFFEVNLNPQQLSDVAKNSGIDRMSIDKTFHGILEATSRGEMLAMRTEPGSAGYVAMEVVTGLLDGRRGSFALQHSSMMTEGKPEQSITVVPGSGTHALKGLAGHMTIAVRDGEHAYSFEYTLPRDAAHV